MWLVTVHGVRDEKVHTGIFDVDTGALTELGQGYAPKWSPDSTRLTFVGDSNGSSDIFIIDADGSHLVQLTDDAAFDTFPIWAPDGETILFLSHAAAT